MADAGAANKSWWGPRIWRILHSLAEINDRTDTGPAWRQTLGLTAEILPCVICREHFRDIVRRMAFPIGVSNYRTLRHSLWSAHASTGSGSFPEENLSAEYGGERDAVITRVTGLITEVVTAFQSQGVLDRLHVISLLTWQRAISRLSGLLRCPQPPPPPPVVRSNRDRRRIGLRR